MTITLTKEEWDGVRKHYEKQVGDVLLRIGTELRRDLMPHQVERVKAIFALNNIPMPPSPFDDLKPK